MTFRIVKDHKEIVSAPQDMEVSAEDLERVLNAVLQKSKCLPMGTGLPGEEE